MTIGIFIEMKESMRPKNFTMVDSCRICNGALEPIFSLGVQYITNFIENKSSIFAVPLDLVLCKKKNGGCGLLQMKHTVSPELLYRKFWYKSGINQIMRNALAEITTSIENLIKLQIGDIIVDIGSNDGTLLRSYNTSGLQLIGFEPASNLIDEAKVDTNEIINDFFSYEKFKERLGIKKAKVITTIAMFYDLEDPNKFVKDIVDTLDENGMWIIQMNYLGTMIENNAFDNIVHEHLEYYSLNSLEYLLNKHNLEIFDVLLNEVNGGSFRVYVKHKNCGKYTITKRVPELRNYERKMGLDEDKTYHKFFKRITSLKEITFRFIKSEVEKGKTVYAYGASTRGNTLLQFYGLDHKLIRASVDRNPSKWGKKTVGTEIPIISEEHARTEKPDYLLILPWYFIGEFTVRESKYLEEGGKFIVPLPNFQIIEKL